MSKKILETIERTKRMRVDVLFEKAMTVTDQKSADTLLQELVSATVIDLSVSSEEALKLVKESLGYMTGYYSHETRERVERFFNCEHPVFGKIAEKGPPTMEEALKAGIRMGEAMRKQKEAEDGQSRRN